MELGLLGKVPPRHRSRARSIARQQLGAARSEYDGRRRRRIRLLHAARAGSGNPNLAGDARLRSGFAEAHAIACPITDALRLLDVRQAEQLVYGASAAIPVLEREIEQQENLISILVGENPRGMTSRTGTDRSAASARSSRGSSLISAGAQARHPRSRSAIDGGQRANRRRKSRLFSRRSLSPVSAEWKVSRSPIYLPAPRVCGRSQVSSLNRFTRAAACAAP